MVVIVMGVSGSGKTVVGQALAERLGIAFIEGDDHHPPGNIQKMARGTALTDQDRLPWLRRINQRLETTPRCVVACSALNHRYRHELLRGVPTPIHLIYLKADHETIERRLGRREHFFQPSLLRSQFQTLEEPDEDEAVILDATQPIGHVIQQALHHVAGSEGHTP